MIFSRSSSSIKRPVRLRLEPLELRAVPSTVTDATDDDDYADTPNWSTDHKHDYAGPDGQMSIREALRELNAGKGGSSLDFSVDSITLTYGGPLLPIDKRVTITGKDAGGMPGTTINGNGEPQGITLAKGGSVKNLIVQGFTGQGIHAVKKTTIENNYIGTDASGNSAMPNDGAGILVSGKGSVIKNNVISGNSGDGIVAGSTSGIKIQGNKIGVGADGKTVLPNQFGVVLHSGANGNTIGGRSAEDRNIISGNLVDGILMQLSNANKVLGNYIGLQEDGSGSAPNLQKGVHIHGGSKNKIGGTKSGEQNVIASNGVGVFIQGFDSSAASRNNVMGNLIGLDANETTGKGNIQAGVILANRTDRNTIGGTKKGAGNVISGNFGPGISLMSPETTGNKVQGNQIGTDSSGSVPKANAKEGVLISSGASGNLIGGPSARSRNIISGNSLDGVKISGSSSAANLVSGNYIGTDASGSQALKNLVNGVRIDGARDTIVGGTKRGSRNVISGNDDQGLYLRNATHTQVLNNFIGTDATGTSAIANHFGLVVEDGSNNEIGNGRPAGRNLISGNSAYGLDISGTPSGTIVSGNYIGTDVSGTSALGNEQYGVLIAGGPTGTLLGTPKRNGGNLISGNNGKGVSIQSAYPTTLYRNYIGTDRTGKNPLGNTGDGISIFFSDGNRINTPDTPRDFNIIAFNGGKGIEIEAAENNSASGNLIFNNGGLGIENVGTANHGLGAPAVSITSSGGFITISGTVVGATFGAILRIELFGNPQSDPSGFGEGTVFLGSVVEVEVDASNQFVAKFKRSVPAGYRALAITVTYDQDTSEFSNTVQL